jgi:O-antigen/teichoic acid export membrane protein
MAVKRSFNRITLSRLSRDSAVIFVGNVLRTAISIMTSIIIARILGQDNYGFIILAMAAVNAVVQFMDVRTSEGLIKFMGGALALGNQREAVTYFHIALGVDTLLMVATVIVVSVVSPLLVATNENAEVLQQLVWIYLFTVPFSTLENTFSTVLIVYKQFRLHAFKAVVKSLVLLFCLSLLAARDMSALMWGYVIGAAFTFGVSAILAFSLMMRNLDILRGQDYLGAGRQFLPFAFHTSLMASLKAVSTNIDILLLGALRPPGEVAFYKVAHNAASLMSMPVSPMGTVIYPAINEAWAQQDMARVKHLVKQFVRYSATISLSITLFLMLGADILILLTYGAPYVPAANLIRLLAIGITIESIARWMRPTVLASGNPQLVTFSGILALTSRLVTVVPLAWLYGAMGSALAYIIGVLVSVGVNTFFVLPRIGLWRPFARKA